jgi:hypothetical protein
VTAVRAAGLLSIGTVVAGLAVAAAGCQSTQATSAERQAEGKKLIESDKGLVVAKANPDIKVVDSTVLSDGNGSAVVVQLKNESDQGFVNVPILIDVRDVKGKSVFKNTLPGLVDSLTEVPEIGPGQTVDWVNDQVLATGKPDSVKVKVGASADPLPDTIPEIDLGEPKLKVDPVSGTEASGSIENKSQIEQKDLTLFAVARDGGKIVAAGRGGVKRLVVDPKRPATYHIFFIGDPEGADIDVSASPTQLR